MHCLVSDGLFDGDAFQAMPVYRFSAQNYLEALWEKAVARYCIKQGFVTEPVIKKILTWRHTGFSVYTDTRIDFKRDDDDSVDKMRHMIRYITKAPVSLERVTFEQKKVIIKGHFHKGHKRNFQIFEPEDFIAAYTSHIPKHRQKYVNFYGVYSNRTRGAKKAHSEEGHYSVDEPDDSQKQFKRTWAMLLQKLFEVDPLCCPKCKAEMKVVAIIDDREAIRSMLEQLGFGADEIRGPPEICQSLIENEADNDFTSEPFDDGWWHGEDE